MTLAQAHALLPGSTLVGADGLWSNVRKQIVGDSAPRVSGHTTYRSVIPAEQIIRNAQFRPEMIGVDVPHQV